MDARSVDMFLFSKAKCFPQGTLPQLRQQLMALTPDRFNMVTMTEFKEPNTALILSILIGSLGVDRFYIGDIGLGIGKLLTGGGCGIWAIIDWFLISDATRQKNLEALQQAIGFGGGYGQPMYGGYAPNYQ